jgi:hypothetical protein
MSNGPSFVSPPGAYQPPEFAPRQREKIAQLFAINATAMKTLGPDAVEDDSLVPSRLVK